MTSLQRGIAPDLLLSQVKNTMPYLFDDQVAELPLGKFIPAQILREFSKNPQQKLNHFEYFRLCVCCHYLTCATPVPTDVDIQIRKKLWPSQLPLEVALQMTDFVIESRKWDFTLVSKRYSYGEDQTPWSNEVISGHTGEWFTIAAGAYCALKQYSSSTAQLKQEQIYSEISDEVNRHSEIFGTLWRAENGLAALKATAPIAHNFGDLDRAMDMWDLSITDPLRSNYYKLTTTPFDSNQKLRYLGRLWVAGQLYKSMINGQSISFENHRHFALRKPKCLRKSPDLMIHTGPFFDDWGKQVAQSLGAPNGDLSDEIFEVIQALKNGWERLPKTTGYGRALSGICNHYPQLRLEDLSKQQRIIVETPQDRFEEKWRIGALKELDEIPSRA